MEAKQKQLREASGVSEGSLQTHSVETQRVSGGLWSRVLGLFGQGGVKDAVSAAARDLDGRPLSIVDSIIFDKAEDPVHTAEVFEEWGHELQVDDSADAFLEKLGLGEMGGGGQIQLRYEHLLRFQLLSDKIRALEHNASFRGCIGLESREAAYRAFFWIKNNVLGEGFRNKIASMLMRLPLAEGEKLCEEGIPTQIILDAVLFLRLNNTEVELQSGGDGGPVRSSPFALVAHFLLPFSKNKEEVSLILDSVSHLKNLKFDAGGLESDEFVLRGPQEGEARAYGAGGFGSEMGDYLWEDLALIADSIQKYLGLSNNMDDRAIGGVLRTYTRDYFERADLNFITAVGPVRTHSGELLSKIFLKKLSLGQLAAVLPEETFASLNKVILSNFEEHEPFLDQASIRDHLQPEAAHKLVFGATFFDRERVGSAIRATPSEAQLKAFCKEVMSPDDYEQVVENRLHPPSPVDLMRALKPEDIVELFNRNGVWSNYTDEHIEKMLPEGVAMIDILDARDGG